MERRTTPNGKREKSAATGAIEPPAKTITEQAFRKLRALIVNGSLPPGAWLVETDLVKRLGLGRSPVRDALRWLHHDGYAVQQRSNRTYRTLVAPLTCEDAGELYAIVRHLEVLATAAVIRLPQRSRSTLADALHVLNIELAMLAGRGGVDLRPAFEIDHAFHARIVAAANVRRLSALHSVVRPHVDRYWQLYASSNDLQQSVHEHDAIIAATRDGNAVALRYALERNWTGAFDRLRGLMAVFGERGTW